ncbi:MAG: hypothetical protein ACTHMR_03600, partial [Thermomicrobiales bacterium]
LLLSTELGDAGNIASCLTGLAEVAAARDELERAARLWGAAEALLASGKAAMYAYMTDRSQQQRAQAAARSRADARAWATAWEQGRAMTVEEAVAYATAPRAE